MLYHYRNNLKILVSIKFKLPLCEFVCHKSSVILGIETSCDDTGCAIVDISGKILADTLYTQNPIHLRYGGINPLFARELHRNQIENVVSETLSKASLKFADIDAIAVTTKPGLRSSLEIGVMYAKYLSRLNNKPLIPIHHMEAHALVARLYHKIDFPYLVLLISGGHCLLAIVKDVEEYILLGESLDDSPGEAFDKTSRRMKLRNIPEYSNKSGGQAIELAAAKATNPQMFQFPLPLVRYRDCNFSFSGIKDSVVRKLMRKEQEHNIIGDGVIPEIYNLCASFQLAVAKHLVHRTQRAVLYCEKNNLLPKERSLVVSGGVACNNFIYKYLTHMANQIGLNVYRPPPNVCTDNGIMIAWNGVEKFVKGRGIVEDITFNDIHPKAPLGTNAISDVEKASLSMKLVKLKI